MPRLKLRFHRLTIVALAIALIASSLASAGSFVFAQSADELNTATLAQGHAQIVAQGMSAPPNAQSFWRIIKRSIPVRTKAQPADNLMGGTGFVMAGDRAVLVIDQKYKTRTRLAAGESLFVPAGAIQTWASLDNQPASAYTFELVAKGTSNDVPGGRIVYSDKQPFAIPEGDYVIDMVRDVLGKNEQGKLGKSSFNTLVMAMSGALSIQSDDKGAKAVTLKGGQAGIFNGNLTFKSGQDGSVYSAALIGPATGVSKVTPVAKTPTAKATQSPKNTKTPVATATPKPAKKKTPAPTAAPTAQVVIGVAVCPPGILPETGVPGLVYCSAAYGGWALNLVAPDGTVLSSANASELTGSYIAWTGLAPGEYQLIVMGIPPGYDSVSLDGYLCCSVNGGYALTVGDGANVTGTLYLYQPYVAPTPVPAPANSAPAGGSGPAVQTPAG